MPDEIKEKSATTFDANAFVQSILAQNSGDKDAALRAIGRDAKKARDSRNQWKTRAETAEGELATLKKPGSKVLAGDDLKEYEAFVELKVKVKDIKDGLTERDELKKKVADNEFATSATKAAKLVKYKQPTVLLEQLNSRELDLTFRKDKQKNDAGDEIEVEIPYVKKRGDDKAQPTKLTDFFDRDEMKPYKLALMASDGTDAVEDEDVRFVPVQGSGPASQGKAQSQRDITGDYLASRYSFPGSEKKEAANK